MNKNYDRGAGACNFLRTKRQDQSDSKISFQMIRAKEFELGLSQQEQRRRSWHGNRD